MVAEGHDVREPLSATCTSDDDTVCQEHNMGSRQTAIKILPHVSQCPKGYLTTGILCTLFISCNID